MPLVSVIVPCYNYGQFLTECLNSLLTQSLKNWECILVDNGSTDNTNKVCREFAATDKRFVILETENNGPSAARNCGIRIAKGKYIQFLDADDLLQCDKFLHQVEYLEKNPATDLVYSDVRYFNDGIPDVMYYSMKDNDKEWMPKVSGKGNVLIRALVKYNIMSIHAPLFRCSLISKVGMFDETLKGYEDWDLWLRIALHNCSFVYFPSKGTLSLVRSHPGSLNKNVLNMRRYLLAVWWKCIRGGRLPVQFWPYVLIRIEEEFLITLKDAILNKNISLAGGEGLSLTLKFIMTMLIPVFIPFILLTRLIRKIK